MRQLYILNLNLIFILFNKMEKEGVIKLVVQYLNDKGFIEVGAKLEEESGVNLESKHLRNLKKRISENKFEEAVGLILKNCGKADQIFIIPKLRLIQIFHSLLTKFDKVEEDDDLIKNSIELIRKICSSNEIYEKDPLLEKCSSLLFISRKSDLLKKMKEISPRVYNIETLIEYIETILCKSRSLLKTLHPKSLETLLESVVKNQIKNCMFHTKSNNHEFSYFQNHTCKNTNIPYKCIFTIEKHEEEVTNLVPSDSGEYFAAILKSNIISIYQLVIHENKDRTKNLQICSISVIKAHENQITSLQWNKAGTKILTASKDKSIKLFDILTGECNMKIENLPAMVSSAIFIAKEKEILFSSINQKVYNYKICNVVNPTTSTIFTGQEIRSNPTHLVNEIHYSETLNLIILICPTIKAVVLYDYPTKSEIDKLHINDTIVSTAISKVDQGQHLLINSSTSTPVITNWNLSTKFQVRKYFGHKQERLTTKCAFAGSAENFIVSGCDNKELYIWNRNASIPISIIKAHSSSVNSAFWPSNNMFSSLLISGSDDHTIKIFSNDEIVKTSYFSKDDLRTEIITDKSKTVSANLNSNRRKGSLLSESYSVEDDSESGVDLWDL